MIAPVSDKSIIRLPQKPMPALRGVVEISYFALGREKLGPCLRGLLGIELKGIYLDNTAKIRLLGMTPSLEKRAAGFAIAENIFADLQVELFLTQEQALFLLADKQNVSLLARTFSNPALLSSPQPQLALPEMFDVSDQLRIMTSAVTVGLFKQVMEGYLIVGQNAALLRAELSEPAKAANRLVANLLDAREFAKRLSELTGRRFRVPTNQEILRALKKDSAKFRPSWALTESRPDEDEEIYFRRHLSRAGGLNTCGLNERSTSSSIVLVEDVNADPLSETWLRAMRRQLRGQGISLVDQPAEKAKKFEAGPHKIEILDPNPANLTLLIHNVATRFETGSLGSEPSSSAGTAEISLTARLVENGIELSAPNKGLNTYLVSPDDLENISLSWEILPNRTQTRNGPVGWNYIRDFNFRQIVEALPSEFEPLRLELLKSTDLSWTTLCAALRVAEPGIFRREKFFKAGPYQLRVLNAHPNEFVFVIHNIPARYEEKKDGAPTKVTEKIVYLNIKLKTNKMTIVFSPAESYFSPTTIRLTDLPDGEIPLVWSTSRNQLRCSATLNLRPVILALFKEIESFKDK
ncbi:MAG: hypothetical protein WCW67_07680 [Candidatus Margulisiibacteriota bacterium]|jgi:hypothetical protein